ncbi:MAG TPA: hypothetical protein VE863_13910 [Pyrinomonadaceae bacterium]|nr:hypothetical protein [Pyrinomonadaceae bacterium]
MTNKGIETWMQNHIAEIRKAVESRRKRNPTVTIGGQTLAVATLRDRLQRYNAGTLTPVGIETWMTKNLPEIKAKLKAGTPNKL